MLLIGEKARAYVYSGNWVADCPRPCGNVEHLFDSPFHGAPRTVKRGLFSCSHCRAESVIEWPEKMDEIMSVLNKRPIPSTRNWYPKGHNVAVKFRLPDGQSVTELEEENREHGVV